MANKITDPKKREMIKRIAETMKYYRKLRGYTLRGLADKANCTASLISAIERGKSFSSLNKLDDLADALNIPIETFFNEKTDEYLKFDEYNFKVDPILLIDEFREYLKITKKIYNNDIDVERFRKEAEYLIGRKQREEI